MTRKDGDFEPSPFDYGFQLELGEEPEVVRKMPVCGYLLHADIGSRNGHYCILAQGHSGEHECIPDGIVS